MQTYEVRLAANLKKMHAIVILRAAADLIRAVMFLFFAAKGLTLGEVGLLGAIISLTVIIFEIPSGIIADRFGRKPSLVLAAVFGFITALCLLFANSFLAAATAVFFYGLEKAFRSGADDALVFDSLAGLNKKEDFGEFKSKNVALMLVTLAPSAACAGIIAQMNFEYVFIISLICMGACIVLSATLTEPNITRLLTLSVWDLAKAEKEINTSPQLSSIAMYVVIITGLVEGVYRFHQLFACHIGFNTTTIGIMYGLMFVVAGAASKAMIRIDRLINEKVMLMLIPVGIGITYIVMGFFPSGWFFLLVLTEAAMYGYFMPKSRVQQNIKIPSSENRATILSVINFRSHVLIGLTALVIGFLGKLLGINYGYVSIGVFALIAGSWQAQNLKKQLF